MKTVFLILCALFLTGACTSQHLAVPPAIPYDAEPPTPSREALETLDLLPFELLEVKDQPGTKYRTLKVHHYNGQPYDGWVKRVFPDTEHRYRYMLMVDGLADWIIAFYEDGQLDIDFHLKGGYGLGSQRMWHEDGQPYIYNFLDEVDRYHGLQYMWYKNGQAGREALFEKGELIYEIYWNAEGKVTDRSGTLPLKYQ